MRFESTHTHRTRPLQYWIRLIIGRTFGLEQDAIRSLNSLQSNFAIVDAIRKSGKGMNQLAIPEMIEWCRKLGYQVCE